MSQNAVFVDGYRSVQYDENGNIIEDHLRFNRSYTVDAFGERIVNIFSPDIGGHIYSLNQLTKLADSKGYDFAQMIGTTAEFRIRESKPD